ncbi:MAG TPA: type II toxin-antitoxin system prevent-host-death family antitoxin [Vicinamibacteria bacterium]
MRAAGIREARQSLSVLLEDVRQGHEIVITDRGKPVARLVPPLPLSAKPFAGRGDLRRRTPLFRPPLSSRLQGQAPRPGRPAGEFGQRDVPGPVYLDASTLAMIYFREPQSDAIDHALRGRRDLTVSDLAVTELLAALAGRRLAAGETEGADAARAALLGDLESGMYRRAEIAPATHRAAERLLVSAAPPLGAGDALHLALAMTAGVASFLTYDRRRAKAAGTLGLWALP